MPGRYKAPSVPVEPLLRMIDVISPFDPHATEFFRGHKGASERFGFPLRALERGKKSGRLTVYMADRIACALGFHPLLIWPEFDSVMGGGS